MIFDYIYYAFSEFGFSDIIDILFLCVIFYYLLLLIKGTKSYQMAVGLVLIVLISSLASLLNLTAFSYIVNHFFTYVRLQLL